MRRRRERRGGCMTALLLSLALTGIMIAALALFWDGIKREVRQAEYQMIPYKKVEIRESAVKEKYYYQQMDEKGKNIYKEILQGVQALEEEIYVHSDEPEPVNEIYGYIMYDWPELFWCSGKAETTSNALYSVIRCEYLYQEEEKEQRERKIQEEADNCLQGIRKNASAYEKIKYIYEYIINHTEYSASSSDNQNIYSVFVNKRSVCAGYARATQYLLERAGIPAIFVTGTADGANGKRQSHAWNLVKCDGEYYHVDTTWGDPVFSSAEKFPEGISPVSYDYLCCDDGEIFKTHALDKNLTVPACTSGKYNYYKKNKMYYETYDRKELLEVLKQDIREGKKSSVFKFADAAVYKQAEEDMKKNAIPSAAQYFASRHGLAEVNYYCVTDESLNKLSVYWIEK